MDRRDKTNYYLDMAQVALERGTCLRRNFGAVIVKNDVIVSTGYNGAPRGRANCIDIGTCIRQKMGIPRGERYEFCRSVHAEMNAIRKASKYLGDWRLEGCTMYITLEPCPMCAGAIVQARVDRVVIGSMNAKAGCAGSVLNVLQERRFNHQVELTKDVLHEECSSMLSGFFRELRERRKKEKEKCI